MAAYRSLRALTISPTITLSLSRSRFLSPISPLSTNPLFSSSPPWMLSQCSTPLYAQTHLGFLPKVPSLVRTRDLRDFFNKSKLPNRTVGIESREGERGVAQTHLGFLPKVPSLGQTRDLRDFFNKSKLPNRTVGIESREEERGVIGSRGEDFVYAQTHLGFLPKVPSLGQTRDLRGFFNKSKIPNRTVGIESREGERGVGSTPLYAQTHLVFLPKVPSLVRTRDLRDFFNKSKLPNRTVGSESSEGERGVAQTHLGFLPKVPSLGQTRGLCNFFNKSKTPNRTVGSESREGERGVGSTPIYAQTHLVFLPKVLSLGQTRDFSNKSKLPNRTVGSESREGERGEGSRGEDFVGSFVNLPNLISIGRLVSGPFLGWMIVNEMYLPAFIGLGISGASDWLDGYVARRMGINSVVGSYLDPLADKVLIGCVAVAMVENSLLHPGLVALVVLRDVGLVGGAFYKRASSLDWKWKNWYEFFNIDGMRPEKVEPLFLSKVNTVFQLALVAAALLQPEFGTPETQPYITYLSWLVASTTIATTAAYGVKYMRGPMAIRGKL